MVSSEKGPRGYKVGELWQARTPEKAAELRWGQASRCDAHLGTRSQDLDISPGAEERGESREAGGLVGDRLPTQQKHTTLPSAPRV